MTGFSAEWLNLREAADRRARSPALLRATRLWTERCPVPALRILDLGAGTGSNLRFLAPRLPAPQVWTLIDADECLLEAALAARKGAPIAPLLSNGGLRVQAVTLDLTGRDSLKKLPHGSHLITASALFDLVSEAWCRKLVREVACPGSALLAVLNYDGRIAFDPPHPLDATIRRLFNRHQRRDKGFGPALGPAATATLARMAAAAGASLLVGRSDWRLGFGESSLLLSLLGGLAAAAREQQAEEPALIERWAALREAQTRAGLLAAIIGHLDLLAIWPGRVAR